MEVPRSVFCVLLAILVPAAGAPEADPLETLKPTHPRLLVGDGGWERLMAMRAEDPRFAEVAGRIAGDAAWLRGQPPLEYEKRGKRLLDVSRQALQRIMLWSIARHFENEPAYATRAEKEMLQVAAFRDWNPSHFLDTAEMTAALAIGYDWLYDDLSLESREVIRRAIVDKGIRPGLAAGRGRGSWHRAENNWNQVCFGGLTLGALAVADEAPEPARALLVAARQGIGSGLKHYAPDGVYPEGPVYWGYGSVYQCLMIDALRTALGTTWGLDESPGFLASAGAQMQLTGPSGRYFNFFDCVEIGSLQPAMFWFARRLEDPRLLRFQVPLLDQALRIPVAEEELYRPNRLFGMIALWWSGLPDPAEAPGLPLVWHGDGANPIGVFRSSWTDPDALYLAFKGGRANLSHGHMDAGSFVLEADGVRWALDLGMQDYLSLESKGINLWNSAQDGDRWKVFRLNNRSHSTLTLDDRLHRVGGDARITGFRTDPEPQASLGLTPLFPGLAQRVTRRFRVEDGGVGIDDTIEGGVPGTAVRWAMVTRAAVEVEGARATLREEGKSLEAALSAPPGVGFEVIPADPPDDGFNAANPGVSLLVVRAVVPASGELALGVVLRPGSVLRSGE